MERAIICRDALTSLGIIHADFPSVTFGVTSNITDATENSDVTCSCPRREPTPPSLPITSPPGLKAKEDNVDALREWLLDNHDALTFNVSEHPPLLLMEYEPIQLHIDPNAKPVAVNKPAAVPIH